MSDFGDDYGGGGGGGGGDEYYIPSFPPTPGYCISYLPPHLVLLLILQLLTRLVSFLYSYEDTYEPTFDDDEPVEPDDDQAGQDDEDNPTLATDQMAMNDGDAMDADHPPNGTLVNGVNGNNIVTSGPPAGGGVVGDPSASGPKRGALAAAGATVGFKEKKIPNEKRTTTPYMTKYERARVLGTRALQIRFAFISPIVGLISK